MNTNINIEVQTDLTNLQEYNFYLAISKDSDILYGYYKKEKNVLKCNGILYKISDLVAVICTTDLENALSLELKKYCNK